MSFTVRSLLKRYLPAIILPVVIITACDNTIDPFDDSAGIYSIYGYLEIGETPNYIRISDLNEPMIDNPEQGLDAVATLENLESGEQQTLPDSVVQFEDIYTFNFRSDLEIKPETTYRLTVERSDGAQSETYATTPEIPEPQVFPTGENCETFVNVIFPGVTEPMLFRASVGFDYNGERRWVNPVLRQTSQDDIVLAFTPIQILDLYFQPEVTGQKVWCHELDSDQLYVRYDRLGPDWYGSIDESDTLDVVDGSGRFGGLYRDTFSFEIDDVDVTLLPGQL